MFSFQAIKHITTGDGGMLIIKDEDLVDKAERIRWFGIDRSQSKLEFGKMILKKLAINTK
jgi:dTDP-4-amino-4,6-dideoxygalactose transaminase